MEERESVDVDRTERKGEGFVLVDCRRTRDRRDGQREAEREQGESDGISRLSQGITMHYCA